jgi:hypothetical protein
MHLMSRSDTIYGGSNEIQRNIISERGLGHAERAQGSHQITTKRERYDRPEKS